MPALVSRGRILRLEMENFKSYKGFQTIGPFKDFTAIIGPNGSGKSNLMDAISFVLSVRTSHLRGSQLKDLIYAFDDKEKEQQKCRKAFVRLVYLLANGVELHFTRGITTAGVSEYRIDGNVVNWDEYDGYLRSLGILVKSTMNVLVFQGDVESIVSKNPKEWTALLEQSSGSDEFKRDYEDLGERKGRAEEKTALVYQRKISTVRERNQKKAQKEEAEKHNRLQAELKSLKRQHFLWQLFTIDKDVKVLNDELVAETTEREGDLQDQLVNFEKQVSDKKKEHAKHLKEIIQLENKIAERSSELEEHPELLKLNEEMKRLSSKIKSTRTELNRRREEGKKITGVIQEYRVPYRIYRQN